MAHLRPLLALLPLVLLSGCGPHQRSLAEIFAGRTAPVMRTYGELRAAETGNPAGPLVLLVHGTPGGWTSLAEIMSDPALDKRALVVAVDRPGWGESSPDAVVASVESQANALKAVLDAHPRNLPAIVVGHSYGGPVVARLAMDEPSRVGALVIVAGSIDPDQEKTAWYQALGRWAIIRPFVPGPLRKADEEIIPLKTQLTAMLPGWATIRQPVTVIQGETDELVPAANADFAKRMITNAPLQIIRLPGQGHFIPWENRAVVTDAILRGLDAPPPAAP